MAKAFLRKALLPSTSLKQLQGVNSLESFSGIADCWSFDYFFYNAAKRSLRERFAAYLILAPISPETLTASAFQGKSAQFSQKSSDWEDEFL